MPKQKSVRELLSLATIRQLALPSNLRYGTAIYERGAVEFIENTPEKVEAWVGGLDGSVAEGGRARLYRCHERPRRSGGLQQGGGQEDSF